MNPHRTWPPLALWEQHQVQLNAKDDSIPDASEEALAVPDRETAEVTAEVSDQ